MLFSLLALSKCVENVENLYDVRATVVNQENIHISDTDHLYSFLYNSGVKAETASSLAKKAKFSTKIGVIVHKCRFGSLTTEELQSHIKACGDSIEKFKKVYYDDICRIAFRSAEIFSIEKNGSEFIVKRTYIEGGAYTKEENDNEFWLAFCFEYRHLLTANDKFYEEYDIVNVYFPMIERKFKPLLKQYY